mmetsp:Transcript_60156/g.143807  ORF Transcript_60156/g.143807 Transcript_60156/m.143807 type:complete len:535 (+) Transcript_60156:728-2332(+)
MQQAADAIARATWGPQDALCAVACWPAPASRTPPSGAGAHAAEDQQQGSRRRRIPDLWAELDRVVSGKGVVGTGLRSKALRSGRTKSELLTATFLMVKRKREAAEERARGEMKEARNAFQGPSSLGLVALQLGTGQILHASGAVCAMGAWMCPEGLESHFLRPLLHPEDTHAFQAFMNQLLLDLKKAGDFDPVTFAAAHLVGRTVSARMLHRPPGPVSLRNPGWIVVVTQRFTFTLASIQVLHERGEKKFVAVLVVDLREPENTLLPLHVAHMRNLIQVGAFNKQRMDFEWDTAGMDPFEMIRMTLFGPPFATDSVLASMARNAMNKAAWIFQKTMSIHTGFAVQLDHDEVLHFKMTPVMHLPFGGRLSQERVSRAGYAQKVSTSSDKSWLRGQPEASRCYNCEIGTVVIDTTKEMDATAVSMMASTFHASSGQGGQVRAPTLVAFFYHTTKTCRIVVDKPWSVGDASDRCNMTGHGVAVSHARADTSLDEITEAMHQLATTTSCQEDVPYANHVTVMATHGVFPLVTFGEHRS